MPVTDAVRTIDELAAASTFEETFESTRTPFVARDIGVPVTVAFGTRDWILTKRAQRRDGLPPHTRWVMKPGWGHVPMWVDPHGVAQLILEGTGLRNDRYSSRASWPSLSRAASALEEHQCLRPKRGCRTALL